MNKVVLDGELKIKSKYDSYPVITIDNAEIYPLFIELFGKNYTGEAKLTLEYPDDERYLTNAIRVYTDNDSYWLIPFDNLEKFNSRFAQAIFLSESKTGEYKLDLVIMGKSVASSTYTDLIELETVFTKFKEEVKKDFGKEFDKMEENFNFAPESYFKCVPEKIWDVDWDKVNTVEDLKVILKALELTFTGKPKDELKPYLREREI